jgi:hypothetical protein
VLADGDILKRRIVSADAGRWSLDMGSAIEMVLSSSDDVDDGARLPLFEEQGSSLIFGVAADVVLKV